MPSRGKLKPTGTGPVLADPGDEVSGVSAEALGTRAALAARSRVSFAIDAPEESGAEVEVVGAGLSAGGDGAGGVVVVSDG